MENPCWAYRNKWRRDSSGRGKTLRLQYELYEGARVFQVTRTISQDGKISKEERKIISEPDFEVKDFSDLQRGDRLLGAAIHYGPVEQELKILGVFDKVAKHLDQYGSGFVLSPNGGDCVEFLRTERMSMEWKHLSLKFGRTANFSF